MNKKIIVLILSYNGKHLLKDSISTYLLNTYENFEVVVIDNGSKDGTKEWVNKNYPNVFVLRAERNLKYSGGLNLGMEYAFNKKNADYVLITNNDVKVDRLVISSFVETAEKDSSIGFVTGKVYYYDMPNTFQTVGKKYDEVMWNGGHIGKGEIDNGQYDELKEIAWCDDIYWLVKKEVWDKTNGYDNEFPFQGEDFDWQIRAKNIGYKIYYTHKAKMWHKESMTIGKTTALKAYYDARNPIIIHLKHRTKEQFKAFYKIRFNVLMNYSRSCIFKLKWNIAYANIMGIFSAIIWSYKNGKLNYFLD